MRAPPGGPSRLARLTRSCRGTSRRLGGQAAEMAITVSARKAIIQPARAHGGTAARFLRCGPRSSALIAVVLFSSVSFGLLLLLFMDFAPCSVGMRVLSRAPLSLLRQDLRERCAGNFGVRNRGSFFTLSTLKRWIRRCQTRARGAPGVRPIRFLSRDRRAEVFRADLTTKRRRGRARRPSRFIAQGEGFRVMRLTSRRVPRRRAERSRGPDLTGSELVC